MNDFATQVVHDDGSFGDHLRRMLVMLSRDPELCAIVRDLLRDKKCPDFESFYRLRSAGIVVGESKDESRMRCELYTLYLRKHLL